MKRKFEPTEHGQGSFIEETINGKKYFSYKWKDSSGKWMRKRFPHTKVGEKDREAFARGIINKMSAGVQTTCTATFGEWLLTYIANYRKTGVDPDTYNRFLQYCANVPDTVANTMLDKLQTEQLQSMITGMQTSPSYRQDHKQKPLSYSTCIKIYELVFAALEKARVLRKIPYNPMEAVNKPVTSQKERGIFSREELKRLVKGLRTLTKGKYSKRMRKDYLNLFFFLYAFGLRIGELLALTWDDVDLETQVIRVNKSKKSNKAGQEIGHTKTAKGVRTVPILSDAAYNRLLKMQEESGNSKYLFSTASGNALGYFQVQRVFKKACILSGITGKTLHELRHTFGTNMARAIGLDGRPVPIAELSRIMGHSKISTTQDFYVHSDETQNEALLKSFANQARRREPKKV